MPKASSITPTKILLFSLLFGLTLLANVQANPEMDALDLQGQATNLEDQLQDEHWNLIMIWASYCPVCKEDFPHLEAALKNNSQLAASGIAIDGREKRAKINHIVDQYALTFPNIISSQNDAANLYQFETSQFFMATPTYMLYDPRGKLVAFTAGKMDFETLDKIINKP